jgi:Xaa-Pro aminopeptidase
MMASKRTVRIKAQAPAHLHERVRAVRQRMRGSAAALLVTNPRDIRYLTGFIGEDSWALVPPRGDKLYVISDFRFAEQIAREAPHVLAIMREKSLVTELAKLRDRLKLGRVALQMEYVTLSMRKKLAKELGSRTLMEVEDGLLAQRAVKDQPEVAAIRRALVIAQQAYREVQEEVAAALGRAERVTERNLAAKLDYRMRLLGADGSSFPTIVASGANASLPHAIPGDRKIRRGEPVLVDWGARFGGYCSDLTRVFCVGKMPRRMREVYEIVLEAQMAAIEAIGPGKKLIEIDAVARGVIDKAGYGEQFGHSLGHGIGLDIHEQPTLSARSQGVLHVGQVVTVEPGIYLPGVGGVRIEDDVLITARGCRVLSDLPKSLESAMI